MLLESDARRAFSASTLRSLPSDARWRLVADAKRVSVSSGTTIQHEGTRTPFLALVVCGLVRIYVTAPDGRTMTVRYCRAGALLGVPSLFASPFELPATIQAVTDAELLELRPSQVRAAAEEDIRISRALLEELSERVLSFMAEIPYAVASVRQRVARHLLDLASENVSGSELVAAVGQQELAAAVGTVREVVVRVLRELRSEGILRTGRDRITIVDPIRLAAEVTPGIEHPSGPSGT